MARNIVQKVILTGKLKATSPISVGAGESVGGVDIPLTVDGLGRFFIPGTSIAGALRAWVETRDRKTADAVFGTQDNASWLFVEDALVTLPEQAVPELRSGVGIDRKWGSAAPRFKYERQVLPVGTTIDMRIELDLGEDNKENHIELLKFLACGLISEKIQLGAGKTKGLGWVILKEQRIQVYDLTRPQQIFAWLNRENADTMEPVDCTGISMRTSDMDLTLSLAPKGTAIMVKGPVDGSDIDMLPQVGYAGNGRVYAVIPGSSIKGALRAHAERIVRTLKGEHAQGDLAKQLDVPLVKELFGSKDSAGWLRIRDVYGSTGIEPKRFLNEDFGNWGKAEDHVAIDRFTGGAVDGALYNLLRPPQDWSEMKMDLRLPDSVDEKTAKAVKTLLLFLVRDLVSGMIPIGFGATRGLGKIKVKDAKIVMKDQELTVSPEQGVTGLAESSKQDLLNAWSTAVMEGGNG